MASISCAERRADACSSTAKTRKVSVAQRSHAQLARMLHAHQNVHLTRWSFLCSLQFPPSLLHGYDVQLSCCRSALCGAFRFVIVDVLRGRVLVRPSKPECKVSFLWHCTAAIMSSTNNKFLDASPRFHHASYDENRRCTYACSRIFTSLNTTSLGCFDDDDNVVVVVVVVVDAEVIFTRA
jgi:hypothetical protein